MFLRSNMPNKGTSAESTNDEQANGASNLFQQGENSTPLSDTTLKDLPIELLESILVEAVVMDVKDMKLAKRVWKAKADLAISRLGTVCVLWNNILTTDIFQNKVHRILDLTAEDVIRLDVLHQSRVQNFVFRAATVKDEMFMLCKPKDTDPFINVCDRNNLEVVKDVIPLPGILPQDMVACNVSHCVYVLNKGSDCYSVLRIARNEADQFNISPWITDLSLVFPLIRLFVSVSGNLVILSHQDRPKPTVVSTYSTDGSKQFAISLCPVTHEFRFIYSAIQKSDGNLVLAIISETRFKTTELMEIDPTGRVVRQHRALTCGDCGVSVADAYGRIMIAGRGNTAELLDAEFNLLDVTVPDMLMSGLQVGYGLHYNVERNEIVRLCETMMNRFRVLIIFRFSRQ